MAPTVKHLVIFVRYYTACTSDYWYHGAPGGNWTHDKCGGVDFQDSTAEEIIGATMDGLGSLSNTYDRDVFTARAVNWVNHTVQLGRVRARLRKGRPVGDRMVPKVYAA